LLKKERSPQKKGAKTMGYVGLKSRKSLGRAALYARVSSEQQIQTQTIDSQVESIKQRMVQDGLDLDPELFFIDDGYSGASLQRPALERLRDMAAMGALDRIYAHCPDRLARKYAYQVLLIDELERCGVEIVFLNHDVGDSPEEQLLLQVQGMVAEYERAKIMERSRRGKLHAARQGSVSAIGKAPYGYRYISGKETHGQAVYQIDLEKARTVRQIFGWAGQERVPLQEIGRRLDQQGILTPTGKNKWSRTSIWQILKNPAYRGSAAFGRTHAGPKRRTLRPPRGAPEQPRRAVSVYHNPRDQWIWIDVPAIVSPELFETVQEQLAQNRKKFRQHRRGASYLLQGLLVCKHCGYAYYGKPAQRRTYRDKTYRYGYYRCIGTDAYRYEGHRVCDNKPVRIDRLDEAVWQDVCLLLKNPSRITQEYERRLHRGHRKDQVDQLEAIARTVKRGLGRLIDAYQESLIDRTEFEPRLEQSRQRLAHLNEQIQALDQEQNEEQNLRLVVGQLESFTQKVEGSLEQADWTTKRDIIRTLVKHIEIDQEAVKVAYRVNDLPFAQTPEKGCGQHCSKRVLLYLWPIIPCFEQSSKHICQ
jgi:site-specific DNA recombinase